MFILQSPGFSHLRYPHHICKLHKVIDGLKQAPRAWFFRLTNRLQALRFHGSRSDFSLHIQTTDAFTMYILIYVDDIIITCYKSSAIDQLLHSLSADFEMKNLGGLNFFLEGKVVR